MTTLCDEQATAEQTDTEPITTAQALSCWQGDTVKALGEGRVGGYLIRYGTPDEADLEGEFFTPNTDFGAHTATDVYFDHGLDPVLGRRRLGRAKLRRDAVGVWVELVLQRRDAYEHELYRLAEAGKLGWSSGTAAHLVARAPAGKARRITHWPLGLDASLTPTPAEFRNRAILMKGTLLAPAQADGYRPHDGRNNHWSQGGLQTMANATTANATTANAPAPAPTTPTTDTTDPQPAQVTALRTRLEELEATLTALRSTPTTPGGFVLPGDEGHDGAALKAQRAFERYIRTGTKALEAGTPAEGGYLVPDAYASQLSAALREGSVLRQAGARVLRVGGTDAFKVPTMISSSAAVLTAEEAAFDEAEPSFGEVTFTPYKYTRLAKASEELLLDSRIDVVQNVLMPDFAQAFAAAENAAFATGTGTAQPQGIVTASTLGVTAASATTIAADEVIDLYHSLGYLYRQRAVWLMNDATLALVRKLKDQNDQYLWQAGLAANRPDLLLGRPVYTLNTMATVAASARVMVLCDPTYFWIMDWGELQMQRLNELYATNGQVGFRAYRRMDSRLMLGDAAKHLVMDAA